jgi:hypothetical protein
MEGRTAQNDLHTFILYDHMFKAKRQKTHHRLHRKKKKDNGSVLISILLLPEAEPTSDYSEDDGWYPLPSVDSSPEPSPVVYQ